MFKKNLGLGIATGKDGDTMQEVLVE